MTEKRPHIANTHYKRRGAGDLMSYMAKNNATLHNRVGMEMTPAEQEDFQNKSEYHEFTRDYIISPADNDLSDEEMQEAVRDSVDDYFDGPSVDFCYAVHDDIIRDENDELPEEITEDDPELHAHVAVTGQEEDLYMDDDDLRDFKNHSREVFQEVERDYEILRKLERIEKAQEQEEDLDDELEWK
jgi:hypothetical protein